jgi:galactitol-specific phosphotransferase system IIB component
MVSSLVAAWNAKQEASVASFFHADITQKTSGGDFAPTVANDTASAANATDLATSLTLVNQLKGVTDRHFVDTRAHNTAVSAVTTLADATDLTTAIALANDIKSRYNTGGHVNGSNIHFNNDSTNTIAAANATDQTTLDTLLNELKTDVNAHIISAPLGAMIQLVPA